MGLVLLGAGTLLLYNSSLLLLANTVILAGLVLVCGVERTLSYWRVVQSNRCCGRGLARAGLVVFLSGAVAGLLDKLPLFNRLHRWIPLLNSVVDATTDTKLEQLARCKICMSKEAVKK